MNFLLLLHGHWSVSYVYNFNPITGYARLYMQPLRCRESVYSNYMYKRCFSGEKQFENMSCSRTFAIWSYNEHSFTYWDFTHTHQGRPQDLGGGGAKNFFFEIWKFACREATCCAWRSHALC